jgi:Na+-transporting methylmalonyl-CoA/oxaloacetate decarboxylase gamma subunit
MKTKHILKIFFILFLFLIALFVYRLSKLDPIENFNPEEAAKNVLEVVSNGDLRRLR